MLAHARQPASAAPQPQAEERRPAAGRGNAFRQDQVAGSPSAPEEGQADRAARRVVDWMFRQDGEPAPMEEAFSALFGADISGVPVVSGSAARQRAGRMGAEAFAQDETVFLPGQEPGKDRHSAEVAAHEYAHVLLGHAAPGLPVRRYGGYSHSGTLRRGDTGSAVSSLQSALVSLGYMTAAQKATGPGIFGPLTESAVKAFQRAKGLEVDGIVGPKTGAALAGGGSSAGSGGGSGSATGFVYSGTLRRGDTGSKVEALQSALVTLGYMTAAQKATGPGVFGPLTESAVKAFQRAKGLEVDGIVGPKTGAALAGGGASAGSGSSGGSSGGSGSGSVNVGDADPKGVLSSSNLNPTVKSLAQKTVEGLQRRGYEPYVFEGFRSFERQSDLYDQGRTKPGDVVTWVDAGGSWHNYGLAVDIVFWNDSHTGPSWSGGSTMWSAVGSEGLAAGFTRWLGSAGDYPHLEYHPKWGNDCTNLASTYYSSGLEAVWKKVS